MNRASWNAQEFLKAAEERAGEGGGVSGTLSGTQSQLKLQVMFGKVHLLCGAQKGDRRQ